MNELTFGVDPQLYSLEEALAAETDPAGRVRIRREIEDVRLARQHGDPRTWPQTLREMERAQ